MSLLVTGSIGIDTVKTPYGVSENCLGGSAVYFSMAASFFSPVRLIGVIGADCPFDMAKVFEGRDVDLAGLEVRKGSKTFRWAGSYYSAMSEAITDKVELNVLSEEPPNVPEQFKDSEFVFLANTAPVLQRKLLEQIAKDTFVAADTMNCWIHGHRDDLETLLEQVDCLVLNEDEARMLAADTNLVRAGEKIMDMGPGVVVIKKGESGSIMCNRDGERFILAAYPAGEVRDPTGAGDSFAGALMGYLAKVGKHDSQSIKKAMAYGTVLASFAISDFSVNGLTSVSHSDIENRFETLRNVTRF